MSDGPERSVSHGAVVGGSLEARQREARRREVRQHEARPFAGRPRSFATVPLVVALEGSLPVALPSDAAIDGLAVAVVVVLPFVGRWKSG